MQLSLESSDTKVYGPQPDTSPPLVNRHSPNAGSGRRGGDGLQGYLAHKKHSPRGTIQLALCLGTYGDPRGMGVSHERGTLVGSSAS